MANLTRDKCIKCQAYAPHVFAHLTHTMLDVGRKDNNVTYSGFHVIAVCVVIVVLFGL